MEPENTDDEEDIWWYVCTLCYRAFTDISQLRGHKRIVHGSAKDTTSIRILSQSADLEPKIKIARSSFNRRADNENHSSRLRNGSSRNPRGGVTRPPEPEEGRRRHRSSTETTESAKISKISSENPLLPALRLTRCDKHRDGDGEGIRNTLPTELKPEPMASPSSEVHEGLDCSDGNIDDVDSPPSPTLTSPISPGSRNRHRCHICDVRTYATRVSLRRHWDVDHNFRLPKRLKLERTVKCPMCPKMFTQPGTLTWHEAKVHGIKKPRHLRQREPDRYAAEDQLARTARIHTETDTSQAEAEMGEDIVIKEELPISPATLHWRSPSPSSCLPDEDLDWDPDPETELELHEVVPKEEVDEDEEQEDDTDDPPYSPVQEENSEGDEGTRTRTTKTSSATRHRSRQKCQVCGKNYALRRGLMRHVRTAHKSELEQGSVARALKLVKCPICQQLCVTSLGLRKHHYVVHVKGISKTNTPKPKARPVPVPAPDPFMCTQCGKMLKSEATLKCHNFCMHSGKRPYKCEYDGCGATFKYCVSLKRHAAVHVEGRPFLCSKCPSSFKTEVHLTYHIKGKHVDGERLAGACTGTKCPPSPPRVKPRLVCRVCGLEFPGKVTLRSHEFEVHDFQRGVVRYKCKYCDRQFSEAANLRRHEPRHTGERRFKCEFPGCGKTYKIITHLKDHAVRHLPYEQLRHVCEHCQARFGLAPQLRDHKRKVHGEMIPKKHRLKPPQPFSFSAPMPMPTTANSPNPIAPATVTAQGGDSVFGF